jgi:hypothetical protein
MTKRSKLFAIATFGFLAATILMSPATAQDPRMMRPGMAQPPDAGGMNIIEHVEGRIAFLHAELKITDAQANAWKAFADALRSNAQKLGAVRQTMATMFKPGANPQPSLADRLELQEQWLAARLEGTRAIRTTLAALLNSLSDDQKKTANELIAPHIGLIAGMI